MLKSLNFEETYKCLDFSGLPLSTYDLADEDRMIAGLELIYHLAFKCDCDSFNGGNLHSQLNLPASSPASFILSPSRPDFVPQIKAASD